MIAPRSQGELLLFRGYGVDLRRTERCVCGGSIVADEGKEQAAVMLHNRQEIHLRWRFENGR